MIEAEIFKQMVFDGTVKNLKQILNYDQSCCLFSIYDQIVRCAEGSAKIRKKVSLDFLVSIILPIYDVEVPMMPSFLVLLIHLSSL